MNTEAISRGTARHHRRGRTPASARGFAVMAGILLALAISAPAIAHADLVESSPMDAAVLESPPTTITLTFSEVLDAERSSFKLLDSAGTVGTGTVTEADAKVMTLDGLTLAAGDYEVRWTAASPDGHLIRGTLAFTVAEATPVPATSTPSTPPAEPTSAPTSAPTAEPASSEPASPDMATAAPGEDTQPASTGPTDVLIPIAAGLIVVVALGALVLRRSRGI